MRVMHYIDISVASDPDEWRKVRPLIRPGDEIIVDAQQFVDAAIADGIPMPLPPEGFKLDAAGRAARGFDDEAARRYEAFVTTLLRDCWETANS